MFKRFCAFVGSPVAKRFFRGFIAVTVGAGLSYVYGFAGTPEAPALMQSAVFTAAVLAADKWVRSHFGG